VESPEPYRSDRLVGSLAAGWPEGHLIRGEVLHRLGRLGLTVSASSVPPW
jgi:hypothetical protein